MEKISALPAEAEAKAGQKGQALLIILLVMVVGLTVGLSLATRSVTDIKISTQLEESSRAFAAAEAGIEVALKGESAPPSPVSIGNATYTFTSTPSTGTEPVNVGIADTYTVWLVSHDASGNPQIDETYDYDGTSIDVCWGEGGETTKPAMEVSVIYKDATGYKVVRGAYDPDSGRISSNHFTDISGSGVNCGGGFAYGTTVSLPSGVLLIALRLRPFYLEANVGVAPQGDDLPSQGLLIASTGTAGETTRKVVVIDSYPSLPAIFDYVLFSGTNVTHE
ncbi:MAG: Uncharacterized protein LiPW16_369 [Microgenomates group bacterium LiPW_16]|nr:MAG: Uncharacterized protein LiPW16_369 [Microgenomates group bacterium LiPW_16]